jgi:hypothetical protein
MPYAAEPAAALTWFWGRLHAQGRNCETVLGAVWTSRHVAATMSK